MSVNTLPLLAKKSTFGLNISGASLRYHDSTETILAGLSMRIPAGEWTCVLGRSGCGKSSLLRYLANLLDDKVTWVGQLHIQSQADFTGSIKENIAYMAQQDLLMPWLSVLDNTLLSTQFGDLHCQTKNLSVQLDKAHALLKKVGLADQSNNLPQQLSGGMRQRVALARTLMQDKPMVLMDEPFAALDAVTRYRLQDLAYQLLQDKTVVLITHDPQEAIRLANRLYIMQGRPAFAESLRVPTSVPPRNFDAECAELQHTIMQRLEQDYQ